MVPLERRGGLNMGKRVTSRAPSVLNHSVVSNSLWPHGCNPQGSSVQGTFLSRILEWLPLPTPVEGIGYALFLDLGGGYMGVSTCDNSSSTHS